MFFIDPVCVSHVTNMIQGKTYRVTAREPDQNKSTKRERESTTRKSWASLARPLASPMPRPHVFQLDKFARHILCDAVCAWFDRKRVLRTNTLQPGEGEMEVCCAVVVHRPEPLLFPPLSLPPPNHQRSHCGPSPSLRQPPSSLPSP